MIRNSMQLLNNIKNHQELFLLSYVHSKITVFNLIILNCFLEDGLIRGYKKKKNKLYIFLKYIKGKSVLRNINFISKPSRRVFLSFLGILKLNIFYFKYFYISTSRGLMNHWSALSKGLGGEVFFVIW